MSIYIGEHTASRLWEARWGLVPWTCESGVLGSITPVKPQVTCGFKSRPHPHLPGRAACSFFLLARPTMATHYRKRVAGGGAEGHSVWGVCVLVCMHMSTQMEGLMGAGDELCEVVGSNGWPIRIPSLVMRNYMVTCHS